MTSAEESGDVNINGETQNNGSEPESNTAEQQQHTRDSSDGDLPNSFKGLLSRYDQIAEEDKSTVLDLQPTIARLNQLSQKLPRGNTITPADVSGAFEYMEIETGYRKVMMPGNARIRNCIRHWQIRLESLSEVCPGEEEKLARAKLEECFRNTVNYWMERVLEHEANK